MPSGINLVCSNLGDTSIPMDLSITVRSAATQTFAKVDFRVAHVRYARVTKAHSTGQELDAFLKRQNSDYDRIIYVGDGTNDFCPAVRLRRYRPSCP
jgi:soluble P-type ATPase